MVVRDAEVVWRVRRRRFWFRFRRGAYGLENNIVGQVCFFGVIVGDGFRKLLTRVVVCLGSEVIRDVPVALVCEQPALEVRAALGAVNRDRQLWWQQLDVAALQVGYLVFAPLVPHEVPDAVGRRDRLARLDVDRGVVKLWFVLSRRLLEVKVSNIRRTGFILNAPRHIPFIHPSNSARELFPRHEAGNNDVPVIVGHAVVQPVRLYAFAHGKQRFKALANLRIALAIAQPVCYLRPVLIGQQPIYKLTALVIKVSGQKICNLSVARVLLEI